MFEKLQERLDVVFKKVKGYGKLSESNIKDSLREVRVALLEADVNYKVAKDFLEKVQELALGEEVMTSITPGQKFVKIVYDEMVDLLGSTNKPLDVAGSPPVSVMLLGLQGSGKTTTAGKLALYLRKKGRRPLLVPTDIYRPAAIQQLAKIGSQLVIESFSPAEGTDPVQICQDAKAHAMKRGFDTLLIDTAGRLHIDEEMVSELVRQKKVISPRETLLVVDAMTGQDAVNMAKAFDEKVQIDGVILTKLDGDARGGAALSVRAVTGKYIKFIGMGEALGCAICELNEPNCDLVTTQRSGSTQNTERSMGSLLGGTMRSLATTRSCLPPVTISPASRMRGRSELFSKTRRLTSAPSRGKYSP